MLILFPFTCCHVCWCMQTCNVYMDNTIIFYFLFYRDSSIIWQTIFNQEESHQMTQHAEDVVGSQAWADGRTKINITQKIPTRPYFVLFSCNRYIQTIQNHYLERRRRWTDASDNLYCSCVTTMEKILLNDWQDLFGFIHIDICTPNKYYYSTEYIPLIPYIIDIIFQNPITLVHGVYLCQLLEIIDIR